MFYLLEAIEESKNTNHSTLNLSKHPFVQKEKFYYRLKNIYKIKSLLSFQ